MNSISPIMVIDNDRALCRLMEAVLTDSGYAVKAFTNPYEGVAEFKNGQYSLVITDIKMPGMDGIDVLEHIKRINSAAPVIIITAHATVDISIQALRKGAEDMLTKPFEAGELLLRVKNVLRNNALLRENIKLKEQLAGKLRFENIIGISKGIKDVMEKVEKVAPRDITVLITGESGTGKELIAQAIHYNSPRKEKPFVAVNCGALPQNLLESELFGHKKGAFTGAAEDRAGLIESADGGTLFLDEIGNLNMEAQKGLLRFLQEKEVRRVGDTKTIKTDVRIISATNANLLSAIKAGAFREDLFYRLNGIGIYVPALRERPEDIPLLGAHFIAVQNKKFNTNFAGFSPEAARAVTEYHWPGNVRQLINVIESALALSSDCYIGLDVIRQFIDVPESEQSESSELNKIGDYNCSVGRFEHDYFKSILEKNKWDIEDASKQAGINIATLYRKIKRYDLKREQ